MRYKLIVKGWYQSLDVFAADVSEALDGGWRLAGGPVLIHRDDDGDTVMAQAVVRDNHEGEQEEET